MNEQLQELYTAYWNRENRRPLLAARVSDGRTNPALRDRAWWMSVDAQLAQNDWDLAHTRCIGDAYPLCCPNLGPDLFAACLGLELTYAPDTSWSTPRPDLCDPEHYVPLTIAPDNAYFRKVVELTAACCEHSKGRYVVGITDIHPGADCLAAFRGPEQLCYDTLDEPDFIHKASMDLVQPFRQLFGTLCDLTETVQKGTSNWMGVWYPGRAYVTSCDFSAMIAPETFRELLLDELHAELDYLDASIFHVDGPGVVRHIDTLLAEKKLRGIQWVYGAGQPTAGHWVDLLRKIQDAGKCIHIDAYPADVPVLLKALRPEGLMMNLVGATAAEAEELFALTCEKTAH